MKLNEYHSDIIISLLHLISHQKDNKNYEILNSCNIPDSKTKTEKNYMRAILHNDISTVECNLENEQLSSLLEDL